MTGDVKEEIKGSPWFDLLPKEVAENQVLWERRRAIYRALMAETAVNPRGALARVARTLGLSPSRVDVTAHKDMKRAWLTGTDYDFVWVERPSPVEKFLKHGLAKPRFVSRRTVIETHSDALGTRWKNLSDVTVHESP